MNILLNSITLHAQNTPEKIALKSTNCTLTYADLKANIDECAADFSVLNQLPNGQTAVMAICVENHPAWAVIDIAAMQANMAVVPIPFFFSNSQQLHALQDAHADYLVTDRPAFYRELLGSQIDSEYHFTVGDKIITQFTLSIAQITTNNLPQFTAKITYTSGTTGTPKGVCLSTEQQLSVAQSLQAAVNMQADETHLCVLPLSTLLENIAGLYTPLLSGATVALPTADECGVNLETASQGGLNPQTLFNALAAQQANTAIFTPELLFGLVSLLEQNARDNSAHMHPINPLKLRFLAVGGASVSPSILLRASQVHLPVFEGYGLSECCSVVALNTTQNHKIGTVGKLLPHAKLRIADDGEIFVQGATLLGYTNADVEKSQINTSNYFYPTGDIGTLDKAGFLTIIGRKKNIFINAFGRNVSPEWVERELKTSPYIAQAIVFGEAKPWNSLLLTPGKNATADNIQAAINQINATLPDYAKVRTWLHTDTPFMKANNQLTSNGRLKRQVIWQHYKVRVNALYAQHGVAEKAA